MLQPFTTAAEAWAALTAQEGMSDGEVVDLMTHQLQTAARYYYLFSLFSFLFSLFSLL
jgi:hypothetical protein